MINSQNVQLKDLISRVQKNILTFFTMIAAIIVVLDMTIVNVSLFHIAGSLGGTTEQASWVLTSYVVAETIAMPLTAWLVSRFTSKTIFLACIIGFTISSMLCGLSTSLPQIVLFRFLQGIFGASIVPISQSLMLDMNSIKERNGAMAIWGMGIMLGPILGPTVGGYLTEYYNWRYAFFINLPIGIAAIIGIFYFLPKVHVNARKLDYIGFLLFAVATCCLQLFLDRGEQQNWLESFEIKLYIIIGIISFWMFLVHLFFYKGKAIIDLNLFKDKNYAISTIFQFCIGLALFSSIAVLPPFLQILLEYSVIDTGLTLAPRGFGTIFVMFLFGKFGNKVDARIVLAIGFILIGSSCYAMTFFNENVSKANIILPSIIQGMGFGLSFVPLATIAYSTLDPKLRSEATSIFSLVRNIGSSIGISMVTFVSNYLTRFNYAILSESVSNNSKNLSIYINKVSTFAVDGLQQFSIIGKQLYQQAFLVAYLNTFNIMSIFAFMLVPLLLFIKIKKNPYAHETSVGH